MADSGGIAVALDGAGHACRVHGSFVAPISTEAAWDVLSDYDHIPSFVSSMVSSHAERKADGRLLVHQTAVGGVFLLRRRMEVVLETHEEPGRRIAFRDVLAKDFESYAGAWGIAADSAGVQVTYRLEVEPRSAIARTFCRRTLRHTAEDLLAQVRAEMMRRARTGP
jgi:ribosome-associated toxin RatA of RatAB toxin-antitoxin module